MNVLNLLLLVVELLWFTPLSANWVFARVAKVKVLRGCFLIHLRYKHNLEMRVIFQSFFKTLPLLVRANAFMLFLFAYFCLSLTKAFKNEGYYCDNVDFEVANKQDCFDWGGDWVRQGINMSSYVASVDFKILFSTTEGWMTIMTDMMNFNGEGLAPSYNANEHFQVYFVAGFFLAGIFLLNIYISILLVGFRKAKEQLSGETKLTELQKQWLRVKSLICEMEPEPKKKPPSNCIKKLLFRICTHRGFKIFQGITFILQLIVCSFYSSQLSEETQEVYQKSTFIFAALAIVEFIAKFIAFSYEPRKTN